MVNHYHKNPLGRKIVKKGNNFIVTEYIPLELINIILLYLTPNKIMKIMIIIGNRKYVCKFIKFVIKYYGSGIDPFRYRHDEKYKQLLKKYNGIKIYLDKSKKIIKTDHIFQWTGRINFIKVEKNKCVFK